MHQDSGQLASRHDANSSAKVIAAKSNERMPNLITMRIYKALWELP